MADTSRGDCESLSIVLVKYKTTDDGEKVRKKVLKKLKYTLLAKNRGNVLQKRVKTFPELQSSAIRSVVCNSTHVVALMRDGRVCRFEMSSSFGQRQASDRRFPFSEAASESKGPKRASLQVQSDEQYARRLQTIYNLEQEGRGLLGGGRNGQDSGSLQDLFQTDVFNPAVTFSRLVPPPGRRDLDSLPTESVGGEFIPEVFNIDSPPFARLDSGVSADFMDFDLPPNLPEPISRPFHSFYPKDTESQRSSKKGKHRSGSPSPHAPPPPPPSAPPPAPPSGQAAEEEEVDWDSNWPKFGSIQWLDKVELDGSSGQQEPPPLFCEVAAMDSEILLVSSSARALYCWPCGGGRGQAKDTPPPPARPHPLTHQLKLNHGGVRIVKSSRIRATVVMDTGDVATFYDPLLRDCGNPSPPSLIADLTHPASPLFSSSSSSLSVSSADSIASLAVGDFMTIAITTSGKAYWWGMLAHNDSGGSSGGEAAASSSTASQGGGAEGSGLRIGCTVRLKDGPKYGGDSAIFRHHPQYGPQIGHTVDKMEAGTLIDNSSVLVKISPTHPTTPHEGSKEPLVGTATSASSASGQNKSESTGVKNTIYEEWSLSQCTLLEDSMPVLGKLIVIDNGQAIVNVISKEGKMTSSLPSSSSKGNSPPVAPHLKVFKVSDLQVVSCSQDGIGIGVGSSNGSGNESSSKMDSENLGSSSAPSSSQKAAVKLSSCRQHTAGVVQRYPVCFVSSADEGSTEVLFAVSPMATEMGDAMVYGHRTLAAQFVEDKPVLLLERVSDGEAYLLLASKSSTSFLRSSSFISLGSAKSSLPKCTIEEESVSSQNAGLVPPPCEDLLSALSLQSRDRDGGRGRSPEEGQEEAVVSADELNLNLRRKRSFSDLQQSQQHKHQRQQEHEGDTSNQKDLSKLQLPFKNSSSLLSNSQGSVLLIHNVYGGVVALDDGLNLKSMNTSCFNSTFSAVCVEDRILDGCYSAMMFVLAPSPPNLLDQFLAASSPSAAKEQEEAGRTDEEGVVARVSAILGSLARRSDPCPATPHRRPSKGKYRVNETSPAKRRKVSSKQQAVDEAVSDREEPAQASQNDIPDFSDCLGSLLNHTTGNRNILHLCSSCVCCADKLIGNGTEDDNKVNRGSKNSPVKSSTSKWPGSSDKASRSTAQPPPVDAVSCKCLKVTRLLLDSQLPEVKAVVQHLLCSRDSRGCTPWMTALGSGKHTQALLLLTHILAEHSKSPNSRFLQDSILQLDQFGMGPLQLLIEGILPCGFPYDSRTKVLRVCNLPPGVTAQQLMELFKTYYPSVYRVEIRDEDSAMIGLGGRDSDSSDSDDDGDDDDDDDRVRSRSGDHPIGGGPSSSSGLPRPPSRATGGSGGPSDDDHYLNRLGSLHRSSQRSGSPRAPSLAYGLLSLSADGDPTTRRQLRSRRRRRMNESGGGHVGVVHFADLHQMRSALSEMDKHRISVSSSSGRSSNFGNINIRSIEIEVEAYVVESGEEDLADWAPPKQKSTLPRRNFAEEKRKCRPISTATEALLAVMLSHEQISSQINGNGETMICSLLHNTAALKLLTMDESSSSKRASGSLGDLTEKMSVADKLWKNAEKLRSRMGQLSDVRAMDGLLRSVAHSLGVIPPPHLDLPSSLNLPNLTTSTAVSSDHSYSTQSHSTTPAVAKQQASSTTPTVPSPLTLSVTAVSSQLGGSKPLPGDHPVVSGATKVSGGESGDPSSKEARDGSSGSRDVQKESTTTATLPSDARPLTTTSGDEIGEYVVVDDDDSDEESFKTSNRAEPPTEEDTKTIDNSSSSSWSSISSSEAMDISSSATSKSLPQSSAVNSAKSLLFLRKLFSNWPGIVTTILGYFPTFSCHHDDGNSPLKSPGHLKKSSFVLEPGHVTHLDNFVQTLLYSPHKILLHEVTSTVINHLNKSKSTVDINHIFNQIVSNEDVTLSEDSLGVVVGCVFLRSIVRLLTVEHSHPVSVSTETDPGNRGSRMTMPPAEVPVSSRTQGSATRERQQASNAYNSLKSILCVFGPLSLLALASACDGIMTSVRVGLSKPLGASSVCAEYQRTGTSSSRPMTYYRPFQERGGGGGGGGDFAPPAHTRQHIRSSVSYRISPTQATPPLPTEGFCLRPKAGASSEEAGDDMDYAMEEEEEWGAGEMGGKTPTHAATSGAHYSTVASVPSATTFGNLIDEELSIIDQLDSSDSSDEEGIMLVRDIFRRSRQDDAEGSGQSNPQSSVYEHAWALDGRVLGETFRGASHPPIDMFDPYMDTKMTSVSSIPSIRFGAAFLTRTHTRLLKDLVDLSAELARQPQPPPGGEVRLVLHGETLPVVDLPGIMSSGVVKRKVLSLLEPSWQWMCKLLDVAEGQLQQAAMFDTEHFVNALRGTTRNGSQVPSSTLSRLPTTHTGGIIGSSPAEYVTYLLRSHTREAQGVLPVLDLYGYEHVVYTLDGYMYLLSNWPRELLTHADHTDTTSTGNRESSPHGGGGTTDSVDDGERSDGEGPPSSSSRSSKNVLNAAAHNNPSDMFFRRSMSVSKVAGGDIGGSGSSVGGDYGEASFNRSVAEEIPLADQPHLLALALEGSSTPKKTFVPPASGMPVSLSEASLKPSAKPLVGHSVEEVVLRWQTAIDVFAHVFLVEGPGSEKNNFLYAHAGVASRMARFRHQITVLRESTSSSRDFHSTLTVRVRRSSLLHDGLDLLKSMTSFHYQQVRVKFDGEDGSGPGVNRGFFTTFAQTLKTNEKTKVGRLMHEPGKLPEQSSLFAPCPHHDTHSKKDKEERKQMFVAIGRFLGLCLWFRQTIPLMICRHVAKVLLVRELAWHDLAFFNSTLYEGFRRMLLDAQEKLMSTEEFKSTYCCFFEAPCGQGSVELTQGGRKIPVTPDNAKEYVHLYAMYVMVDSVKEEMTALRTGLNDIIPTDLLCGITAEDFQLLLSGGCENISLTKLKSCIRFHHSHSASKTTSVRFEKMFWKILSQMTNTQRQQFLYFATGSSAMPVHNEGDNQGTQIAIDVMGGNLESLPIASTCSQRISVPLYPSLHVMRRKLLQAIQCQGYGLA